MILSDKQIKAELGKGLDISPFDESRLNPNSYNLRLADELLVYDGENVYEKEGANFGFSFYNGF